jgi:hypothetical protein
MDADQQAEDGREAPQISIASDSWQSSPILDWLTPPPGAETGRRMQGADGDLRIPALAARDTCATWHAADVGLCVLPSALASTSEAEGVGCLLAVSVNSADGNR